MDMTLGAGVLMTLPTMPYIPSTQCQQSDRSADVYLEANCDGQIYAVRQKNNDVHLRPMMAATLTQVPISKIGFRITRRVRKI